MPSYYDGTQPNSACWASPQKLSLKHGPGRDLYSKSQEPTTSAGNSERQVCTHCPFLKIPLIETFKSLLDMVLGSLLWVSLFELSLHQVTATGPCQPQPFCDCEIWAVSNPIADNCITSVQLCYKIQEN